MSYCIEYKNDGRRRYPTKIKKNRNKPILLVIAVVFVISIPAVRTCLKQFLLPGDPVVTERALASMVDRLGAGEGIYESVTAFCKEIIHAAAV